MLCLNRRLGVLTLRPSAGYAGSIERRGPKPPPTLLRLRAGCSIDGTEIGPAAVPTRGGLVAHRIGEKITFHRLLCHATGQELQAHLLVGLDPPRRRRGESCDHDVAFRQRL